jgi:ribonuclease R
VSEKKDAESPETLIGGKKSAMVEKKGDGVKKAPQKGAKVAAKTPAKKPARASGSTRAAGSIVPARAARAAESVKPTRTDNLDSPSTVEGGKVAAGGSSGAAGGLKEGSRRGGVRVRTKNAATAVKSEKPSREKVLASPKTVSTARDAVSTARKTVSTAREKVLASPKTVSTAQETVSTARETVSTARDAVLADKSAVEKSRRTPEKTSRTPEKSRRTPEKTSRTSDRTRRRPDKISGKIPDKISDKIVVTPVATGDTPHNIPEKSGDKAENTRGASEKPGDGSVRAKAGGQAARPWRPDEKNRRRSRKSGGGRSSESAPRGEKGGVEREKILQFIKNSKRPVSSQEISKLFVITKQSLQGLKKILGRLLDEGEVLRTRNGLYGPAAEMSLVTGYFEAHKGNYGFVISEKPGQRDVFIPGRKSSQAMNNDRVVVRIENRTSREGRVIRILERAHSRLVGKLIYTGTTYFVHPKLKTIPMDILIPANFLMEAVPGDIVIVEITEFPESGRPPAGKILKRLAAPEDPRSEIESVIEEFNLPGKFRRAVTAEAEEFPDEITPEMFSEDRKDLRALNTVTIDGERAKDFDDAISVKRIPDGFKLYVHIADVGFFVPMGSVIDEEARKRTTSVYFPDRVIPMLPRKLSEDLCSLRPKTDRLTFTAEMDFNAAGIVLKTWFYASVINSNERMTYTDVRKILIDKDDATRKKYERLLPDFDLMGELCHILRAERLKRGSLDFDLPEPEIIIDLKGNLETIVHAERNFAHMVVEEFMIAANEAVATRLASLDVPTLYRIHEEPDGSKIEDIENILKFTAHLKKKSVTPKDFPEILRKTKSTPYEELVNYMILRSLKQARYSPENVGHFGLASKCYTHFTSPIRRYPDLIVHRVLRAVIDKDHRTVRAVEKDLSDIAFNCSRRERAASDAEREVISALRTWFMKDKVGDTFAAKIVGINSQGFRVRLREYYVDGFIHVSYLADDFYELDEKSLSLKGRNTKKRFSVGDAVTVRVDRVDVEEREVIFGI